MKVHTEYERVQQAQVTGLVYACKSLFAGNLFPRVLFIKANLSDEEKQSGDLLCGSDGEALEKALIALGFPPQSWAALSVSEQTPIAEFRILLEALDPHQAVLLDKPAARFISLILDCPAFALDAVRYEGGRAYVALEGFASSLDSAEAKRREWTRLKMLSQELTF